MGFAKGLGVFKEPQMILLDGKVREPQVQDVCSDPWNKLLVGKRGKRSSTPWIPGAHLQGGHVGQTVGCVSCSNRASLLGNSFRIGAFGPGDELNRLKPLICTLGAKASHGLHACTSSALPVLAALRELRPSVIPTPPHAHCVLF